jgi:hypothetical protein
VGSYYGFQNANRSLLAQSFVSKDEQTTFLQVTLTLLDDGDDNGDENDDAPNSSHHHHSSKRYLQALMLQAMDEYYYYPQYYDASSSAPPSNSATPTFRMSLWEQNCPIVCIPSMDYVIVSYYTAY